jgi:hypothetical protein
MKKSNQAVALAKVSSAPALVASYALLVREFRPIAMRALWLLALLLLIR